MTDRLRIGIIGCGKMGIQHIRAVRQLDQAELVGVCDPGADPESLKAVLPPGVSLFKDAGEFLASTKPSVVHVVTPPASHFELAKAALAHGAHVLVEKPFTLERKQAEAVARLAAEKSLKICAGHQLLFEKPTRRAESLIPMIGRVVNIESYFAFRPVRRSAGGGGDIGPLDQLIDILPHPVYVLLHFLGLGCAASDASAIDIRFIDARADGEVHAILRRGDVTGSLVVTLNGRPVESYLRIVGTNGSLFLDFVHGSVTQLPGPGTSAVSVILNPYSVARQIASGAVRGFLDLLAAKKKGISPGIKELIEAFYVSVRDGGADALSPHGIVESVAVCETIGNAMKHAYGQAEDDAKERLRLCESELGNADNARGVALVTGGTGFLGRRVCAALRNAGHPVRVPARMLPPFSRRIPGVEYVRADLAEPVPSELLDGVSVIVHCAAETVGKKEAHERNSILATRNILAAAAAAKVGRFIHVSSIAVLKPSREVGRPVDEATPLDLDNEGRGPYVWGKAESERHVRDSVKEMGVEVRIVRLGPLVDFNDYAPPGRLGRELGRRFVCMGSRGEKLSVCDVETAAKVLRHYVEKFDDSPQVLNLVEPDAPSRKELVGKLRKNRPELRPIFVSGFVVRAVSPPLKLLQRILLPGKKPIDIYSAFSSEDYRTDLSRRVISECVES